MSSPAKRLSQPLVSQPLSAEDSPVRIQVSLDYEPGSPGNGQGLFLSSCDCSRMCARIMHYLRTSPGSAQTGLKKCSSRLPKSGMMRNGILYELLALEHPISEKGRSLLPTLSGTSNNHRNHVVGRLDEWGGVVQPVPWNRDWESALREFRGMDDGTTYRVDRIDTIRNAVVPQQVYPILKAIADIEAAQWGRGAGEQKESREQETGVSEG